MRSLEGRDKVVAPQSACLNSSKKVDIAAMRPRRTECRSRKESEVGTDADAPRARAKVVRPNHKFRRESVREGPDQREGERGARRRRDNLRVHHDARDTK